jgi:hypothetical protein
MTKEVEQTQEKEEEKELDLREQIMAAKEEIEAKQVEKTVESEKPEKVEEPEKKEVKEESKEDTEDTDIKPPNSWSKERKEQWSQIPKEAREYISKRESEMHKAITANDELKQAGKVIREVTMPYRDVFEELKDTKPADLIKGYLETERTLRRGSPEQKAALIGNVIKSYGLDLNLLNNAIQGNVQVQQFQPDPRLSTLEQRIAQFEAQQQAQQENQKLSVIQQFMSDNNIDESGINEQFLAEVSFTRGSNPSLSEREVLDRALERYQWTNPELRQSLLAKQQTEASKQDTLKRAKNAASSVSGSPGTGSESDKPAESVAEELRRQFGRANGRI